MKNYIALLMICLTFFIETGFDNYQTLILSNTKITAKENILRYEVKLKTKDGSPLESKFDYQGHKIHGFELAVKPSEPLAELMELDKKSKLTKMCPHTIGSDTDYPNELVLNVEYIIKKGSDPRKVEKLAKEESTLFIFDGANKIKVLSLKGQNGE